MEQIVARLNIERYRHLLLTETDEKKRKLLQTLLAEEQAKLAELSKQQSRSDET